MAPLRWRALLLAGVLVAVSCALAPGHASAAAPHATVGVGIARRGDSLVDDADVSGLLGRCQAASGGLVARMSLQEKAQLLYYNNTGIPRLGLPAFDWWTGGWWPAWGGGGVGKGGEEGGAHA